MERRHGWMLALAALMVGGCFYPADRGRQLEEKVQADHDEVTAALKSQQDRLDQTLPKVNEKIAEMTRALQSLDQASRRSGADIGVQLQKTVEDVAQLRGQVDAYLHNIQELSDRLAQLQTATDQKLQALQGEGARRDAEAKAQAEKLQLPKDRRQFFELAQGKLKAGELPLARQLLREFVKKWPKDELAGEAYFSIGETYFADKACDQALPEYGKVFESYPKARSAPAALLRSSECFRALGKGQESKLALEEILKDYPKSEAARSAKVKLAELSRTRKPKKAAP